MSMDPEITLGGPSEISSLKVSARTISLMTADELVERGVVEARFAFIIPYLRYWAAVSFQHPSTPQSSQRHSNSITTSSCAVH